MNFITYEIVLPHNYNDDMLKKALKKKARQTINSYEIIRKSLDARKKGNIVWRLKVSVNNKIDSYRTKANKSLDIVHKSRNKHVVIVGSGPAGMFSGLVLLRSGFNVTLLEMGSEVDKRDIDIDKLCKDGIFNESSNFAFGEGGAGTYSDGKLTSRSKHISNERDYILATYINNGAPEEIYSMVHPHIGSDNLKTVAKNMRSEFFELGGKISFDTKFTSFKSTLGSITSVETSNGVIDCDYLLLATGHSSFNTYRNLIALGLDFNLKNFALGFRAEHPQEIINRAQWGVPKLDGLKAAEYRLTSKFDGGSIFSFCMCPGGEIVPAAAIKGASVVNGMSNYNRDGYFANAAVVSTFNFNKEFNREVTPLEALDLLEKMEERYFNATGGYTIPAMTINDFINNSFKGCVKDTTYPLGTKDYDLKELLPKSVIEPLQNGLKDFSKKIKGYDLGNIMGLESKTSSPIQVVREKSGLCAGFNNLYFCGEGSGWSGGIVSSGADGIKSAMDIIKRES